MAINLNKIENLLIDEGIDVEGNYFELNEREVNTLYKLAMSGNNKIKIQGVVDTVPSHKILDYQAYQINKAWPEPGLIIKAEREASTDWSVSLSRDIINEGTSTSIEATGIALNTLTFKVDEEKSTCDERNIDEIIPLIKFDRVAGQISCDLPTDNLEWTASLILRFWPEYIKEPAKEDYREVSLVVHAFAIKGITHSIPSRIDENAEINIYLDAGPDYQTKGDNYKFKLESDYGDVIPTAIVAQSRFVYKAPTFKALKAAGVEIPEDAAGEYYDLTFHPYIYVFNHTVPEPIKPDEVHFNIRMQNIPFTVTCDEGESFELIEGEQARFHVSGYYWSEVQKNIKVTKIEGDSWITEEEIKNRVKFFTADELFSMNAPSDNATYTADIEIYIAPPGTDAYGERAKVFTAKLRAIGISGVSITPQTIGQNYTSAISIKYEPAVHTKGIISYGFYCTDTSLSIISRNDSTGIYNIKSESLSSYEVTTQVYSGLAGDEKRIPLLDDEHNKNILYVQDSHFTVKFENGESTKDLDEGQEVNCTVNILHISELKREITVSNLKASAAGSELSLDSDWIKDKIKFSEDLSSDKIWIVEPEENISWEATIKILFIAKYVPEGERAPWSQELTINARAIEVEGVEWQNELTGSNLQIAVSPHIKYNYFKLKTLPYNNTKQLTLEMPVEDPKENSPFSVDIIGDSPIALEIDYNTMGRYSIAANSYSDWNLTGSVKVFPNSKHSGLDNTNFIAKPYHIYTANNPANQCSIEFVNNSPIAVNRVIFGDQDNYKLINDTTNGEIEKLTTTKVRVTSTDIEKVPFFAGSPTSIDQFDSEGNLLKDSLGNTEKGEINIWENFCGKYEEWYEDVTGDKETQVTWDVIGETEQDGIPTPTAPIYPTHSKYYYYTEEGGERSKTPIELYGYTWGSVFYGHKYEYTSLSSPKILTTTIGTYTFTGGETFGNYRKYAENFIISYAPPGHSSFNGKGYVICSHFMHSITNWSSTTLLNTISESGTSFYINVSRDIIGLKNRDLTQVDWSEIQTAWKTWLAAQLNVGTPVKLWYPQLTRSTVFSSIDLYSYRNIHRKYTISKIICDDDTEGDTTKVNKFNQAFVYNSDGSIPNRFFLSRFIPGWHNNDINSVISMSKGLKSQQRTITKESVKNNGCYYRDDSDNLQQIKPIYYGPLLAYTWLSYFTYGTLNLKDGVGKGASKISAEAQVFSDAMESPLVIGNSYSELFILNNNLLNESTYENFDFNLIGTSNPADIALYPIASFKILSIETYIEGSNYSKVILDGNYTAVSEIDYYSLNSCFSETGYSDIHYINDEGNPVVSGYGKNEEKYSDTLHPVKCLNIENMWGGGAYSIGGTAFTGDLDDNTIIHPLLWNPKDSKNQDLLEPKTWERLDNIDVLSTPGTWDVGSYKYSEDSRCGWANEPAINQVPNRGFNVYNRPNSLEPGAIYTWDTGTYNDWSEPAEFQNMCGLGHTNLVHDSSNDYVFVEYIESSGYPYIELGQNFNNHDEVWCKAAIFANKGTTNQVLLGPSTWNSDNNRFGLGGWLNKTDSEFYFFYGASTGIPSGVNIDKNWHVWHYYTDNEQSMFAIDDVKKPAPGNWNKDTDNLRLFRGYENTPCTARVYEIWHKRNGYYLYHLIPCYRKSDGEPGMYDKVTGTFFKNANTATGRNDSDFILGPELNVTRYQKIDYITSDKEHYGEQFINTGTNLSQNVKLAINITSNHDSIKSSYVGGTRTTAGKTGLNIFISTENKLCYEKDSEIIEISGSTLLLPGENHLIEIEWNNNTFRTKIDNRLTYNESYSESSIDTSLAYYLFSVNNEGEGDKDRSFIGNVYSAQLTLNDKVVRSYIPVYNKAVNEYGLYDTIEKRYYGSVGTKKFTGADVLIAVDALTFNGTQYIDTEWTYDSIAKVEITASKLEASSTDIGSSIIFGNEEKVSEEENNNFSIAISNQSNNISANIGNTNINLVGTTGNEYQYKITLATLLNRTELDSTYFSPESVVTSVNPQNQSCYLGTYRSIDSSNKNTLRHKIYNCTISRGEEHPTKYRRVEYIQQPNQYAYIRTDYKPNQNTHVKLTFERLSGNMHYYYGATQYWTTAAFGLYDSGLWFNFNSDTNIGKQGEFPIGIKTVLTQDKRGIYNGDRQVYELTTTTTFQSTGSLSIGSTLPYVDRAAGVNNIYSFEIYEWNTDGSTEALKLIRNYVPVVEEYTQRAGLYETETNTFYPSNGTRQFIAGPDVTPKEEYENGAYITYEVVKHFVPVYNVITNTYGMYDMIGKRYYESHGEKEVDGTRGAVQQISYIENYDPQSDYVGALYKNWNIDTQLLLKDVGKISVDLTVQRSSSSLRDICIVFSNSPTANPNGYLCYSSNDASGVTVQTKTKVGNVVTWELEPTYDSQYRVHVGAYYTENDTGIYNYKRVIIYGIDKTTVLRDMIPIRCGTQGGMYDNITHQVFFNASPDKPVQDKLLPIKKGEDINTGVPGDPGIKLESSVEELTRIFGTL